MRNALLLVTILSSFLALTSSARADGYCYLTREWAPKHSGTRTHYVAYLGIYKLATFSPAAYGSDEAAHAAAHQYIRARAQTGECLDFWGLQYDVLMKP